MQGDRNDPIVCPVLVNNHCLLLFSKKFIILQRTKKFFVFIALVFGFLLSAFYIRDINQESIKLFIGQQNNLKYYLPK